MNTDNLVRVGMTRLVVSVAIAVVMICATCNASDDGVSMRGVGAIDYISITDKVLVVEDKSYKIVNTTEYRFPSGYTESVEHFKQGTIVSLAANENKELILLVLLEAGTAKTSVDEPSGVGGDQIQLDEDGVYRN